MTEDLSEDLARRWVETVDGQLPEGLVEMNADPRARQPARDMLSAAHQQTGHNL